MLHRLRALRPRARLRRSGAPAALLACGLFFAPAGAAAQSPPSPSPAERPADPAPASDPARRAEAGARFARGAGLVDTGSYEAAVAEFLVSRSLYPTWSATYNAAICLQHVQRWVESLELFEVLLKDFPGLPVKAKLDARRAVESLRGVTGAVELGGAQLGAAIVIDAQSRGDYPPLAPLRVASGTHVVHVYKEGYEPFETSVSVAGGQTARVVAPLRLLIESGRLRVAEQRGLELDVLVDGLAVGKTPWEGPIAVGDHTLALRGTESLGTLPSRFVVKRGDHAERTLAAEDLGAEVRVAPEPASASVAIDQIFVGRGVFDGPLRPGVHRVKVVADGYFPSETEVTLARGAHRAVSVALRRDPASPLWRPPPRVTLELGGAFAFSPTFGGDVTNGCTGACSSSLAAGGEGAFHGGVELYNGLGLGIALGYLSVTQKVAGRAAQVQVVGHAQPDPGTADDTLKVRGVLAGAWAGLTRGERFPLHLRLGAGAVVGSVADSRTGTFQATGGRSFTVGPVVEAPSVSWFYVDPEVRLGLRVRKHLELSAGVEALFLIGASTPRWNAAHPINASTDGYGTFPADAITRQLLPVILPGLAARYDF